MVTRATSTCQFPESLCRKDESDPGWYAKSIRLGEKYRLSPANGKTEPAAFRDGETGADRDIRDGEQRFGSVSPAACTEIRASRIAAQHKESRAVAFVLNGTRLRLEMMHKPKVVRTRFARAEETCIAEFRKPDC